ncbi:MAG: aminotransferase class I/II-fold pyridoxal phosphate-dependent enzyme, partial [Mailhella sp.]|nr:aminotransferase class I/II-fold pyridoxal phosphate-dependent enzyme [Mailhella sp.]
MNKKLCSYVTSQRFSVIRSMSAKAAMYDDAISLGIGEPDFDTPAFVCEAAYRDSLKGYTHYAASSGDPELKQELLSLIRGKTGLPYGDENLLVTSGAMHGLLAVMRTLLEPGDEVLCPAPCFSDYRGHCALAGGRLVQVPTSFENGFVPERRALESCRSPRTRALLINSPCNPSGIVLEPETLDMLADFAKEHDLVVVSDEVYDSLVFGEPAQSIVTRPGMAERTVVLNSFSKAYAMTGWRVGYAYGPEWIMSEMIKVLSYSVASTNTAGQRAALAALRGPREPFEAFREAFRRRTALAAERLN